ncbi:sulfatase-like hydrolase/transferase [uncultured Cyclobacterium sp.]|uniref:sulfatase family protein n=1 Tax=uncultured Cyclobacterium sp. TaxID=453820 RepID=UPI0030EF12B7|tara:strand:- start:124533 stop:125972 length:1440 start_codon:yes stop_codon:yes gene_type:complete
MKKKINISWRLFLFMSYSMAAIAGCQSEKTQEKELKPNVLVILTDQHTNDALSYLGNPHLNTPAMDQLAAEGTFFTASYCTSPVCGPARSSLITGRMPHETGVVWNSTHIRAEVPTIGQVFKESGYHTAWVGKWHLPESYPAKGAMDSVAGFAVVPFQSLDKEWDLGEDTDGPIADATVNYLNNYKEDQPFLLTVSLHNPHDICHVPRRPDEYAKAHELEGLPPLPNNFEIDPDEPQFLAEKRLMDHYGDELLKTKDYTPEDWQAYLYHYYRFTEMVDGEIGKILQALKNNGFDENTIVVLTSEHGDGGAGHKWAAKLSLYEEAATVPFIIRYKGHVPSHSIDRNQLVSGIDLAPTIVDYAGLSSSVKFTGKSLKPILENPGEKLRDYLVVQLADDKLDSSRQARLIRNDRYKYNLYNQGERNEQLFDLWKDPGEQHNLAYVDAYQSVKHEMHVALDEWIAATGDDFYEWSPLPNSKEK